MRRLVLPVVLAMVATVFATSGHVGEAAERVDVSGHWVGKWSGYGIMDIGRLQSVRADLTQTGRNGRGKLIFDGVNASPNIPLSLRDAGAMGIRVVLRVSGSSVVMEHELGGNHFAARLNVDGDRMTGRIRDSNPAVYIMLVRAGSDIAVTPPSGQLIPPVAMAPGAPPRAPVPPSSAPSSAPRQVPASPGTSESPRAPGDVAVAPEQPGTSSSGSEPATRPVLTDFQTNSDLKPVYFDFDKAEIRTEDSQLLDASAKWLTDHPDAQLLIEGHADERGTPEYNLALGERRARAAREYLVNHGVPSDRISTVSYGEERPACLEKNEVCWTLNRRSEFLFKTQ